MSLNKFTDGDVKKEWMNINCASITTDVAEIGNLTIDDVDVKQLFIQGENLPQLSVKPLAPSITANVFLGGDNNAITMSNTGNALVGRIRSQDLDNTFTIDPQTRLNVGISAPVHLFKTAAPQNPPSTHVALYSKTGSDSLYSRTSDGVEQELAGSTDVQPVVKTVWTCTQEQNAPSAGTDAVPRTILNYVSSGLGSLTIPPNTISLLGGTGYRLDVSGVFNVGALSALTVSLYIDNIVYLASRGQTFDPVFGGVGGFRGSIYLTFTEPAFGDSLLLASGDITFTTPDIDISMPLVLGTLTSHPISNPMDVDMRASWTTPNAFSYIRTRNASLTKLW